MYRALRSVGEVLSILLMVAAVLLAVTLSFGLLHPFWWFLLPTVGVILWLTLLRMRYRRVTAILEHLRTAFRLNLPLPGTLAAAATSETGRLGHRLGDLADSVSRGVPLADALDRDVPEMAARERRRGFRPTAPGPRPPLGAAPDPPARGGYRRGPGLGLPDFHDRVPGVRAVVPAGVYRPQA